MQSLVRTKAAAVANPLFGNRLSYRVVAAPAPTSSQATRQVVTMAKKKGVRIIVTMECTEAKTEGATPSRYTTQKASARRPRAARGPHSRGAGPHGEGGRPAHKRMGRRRGGGAPGARLRRRAAAARADARRAGSRVRLAEPPASNLARRAQNRRNNPERMELKKYNPYLRRYTLHREIK
jgi:large subunit ribosomal protein L33